MMTTLERDVVREIYEEEQAAVERRLGEIMDAAGRKDLDRCG